MLQTQTEPIKFTISDIEALAVRGVQECWIVDYILKTVEVYHRDQAQLKLIVTLQENDIITSPLLAGFSCQVKQFFS